MIGAFCETLSWENGRRLIARVMKILTERTRVKSPLLADISVVFSSLKIIESSLLTSLFELSDQILGIMMLRVFTTDG